VSIAYSGETVKSGHSDESARPTLECINSRSARLWGGLGRRYCGLLSMQKEAGSQWLPAPIWKEYA